MKIRHNLRYLLIVPLLGASAFAGTIVDWGGNYVSSNTNLGRMAGPGSGFGNVGGGAALDSRRLTPFDDLQALSPGGSGYAGTSATFYGGWEVVRYDSSLSPGAGFQRIGNGGGADTITFRADLTGAGSGEAHGLLLWQKPDFLELADEDGLGFGAGDSLAVTLGSGTTKLTEARWVVKNSTSYLISEATFVSSAVLADPAAMLWSAYDPFSSLAFDGGTFGAPGTWDVQGVGLYFAGTGLTWSSGTVGGLRLDLEGFTASASARSVEVDPPVATVPESASAVTLLTLPALLALNAVHRAGSRRRSRRLHGRA